MMQTVDGPWLFDKSKFLIIKTDLMFPSFYRSEYVWRDII